MIRAFTSAWLLFLLFVRPALAQDKEPIAEPASSVSAKIVEVRKTDPSHPEVWLKITNNSDTDVYIAGNYSPAKLNHICSFVEKMSGGKWERASPVKGLVWGDQPPEFTNIAAHQSAKVKFLLEPWTLGLKDATKLRVVILFGLSPDKYRWCKSDGKQRIISDPFTWTSD